MMATLSVPRGWFVEATVLCSGASEIGFPDAGKNVLQFENKISSSQVANALKFSLERANIRMVGGQYCRRPVAVFRWKLRQCGGGMLEIYHARMVFNQGGIYWFSR